MIGKTVHRILWKLLTDPWPDFEETRLVLADALEEEGDLHRAKRVRYAQGWMLSYRPYSVREHSPYLTKFVILELFDDVGQVDTSIRYHGLEWFEREIDIHGWYLDPHVMYPVRTNNGQELPEPIITDE